VIALLGDSGYDGEIAYLADVLLGALVSELVLFQRRELGMSQAQLGQCWAELVDRLLVGTVSS
jgi:hypothetical protein